MFLHIISSIRVGNSILTAHTIGQVTLRYAAKNVQSVLVQYVLTLTSANFHPWLHTRIVFKVGLSQHTCEGYQGHHLQLLSRHQTPWPQCWSWPALRPKRPWRPQEIPPHFQHCTHHHWSLHCQCRSHEGSAWSATNEEKSIMRQVDTTAEGQ